MMFCYYMNDYGRKDLLSLKKSHCVVALFLNLKKEKNS